jgi:hypothetical protein
MRRMLLALATASLLLGLTASATFAGEVTGGGKSLHVDGGGKWGTGLHARSFCAFSGQEDLQFAEGGSKGVPAHAQNWGHTADHQNLPPEWHPGMACNPNVGPPQE